MLRCWCWCHCWCCGWGVREGGGGVLQGCCRHTVLALVGVRWGLGVRSLRGYACLQQPLAQHRPSPLQRGEHILAMNGGMVAACTSLCVITICFGRRTQVRRRSLQHTAVKRPAGIIFSSHPSGESFQHAGVVLFRHLTNFADQLRRLLWTRAEVQPFAMSICQVGPNAISTAPWARLPDQTGCLVLNWSCVCAPSLVCVLNWRRSRWKQLPEHKQVDRRRPQRAGERRGDDAGREQDRPQGAAAGPSLSLSLFFVCFVLLACYTLTIDVHLAFEILRSRGLL